MNESCHTHEWVMSYSHVTHMKEIVTHMNESFHTHEWVCHTHELVMSHTWMSHATHMNEFVTHMNESCHTHEWVLSHTWMSHVTHMDESCHTHEWVMSHTWMRSTGCRRLIGLFKLQTVFRKRATKHRSLLRKMTYKDKAFYGSSPPCIISLDVSIGRSR